MGFLDAFRKKKEVREKPAPQMLRLEEAEGFYKGMLASALQEAESRSRGLQAQITSLFRSLPLQALEKASFEGKDRRYAAVNMAKSSYVTRVKALLASLPEENSEYQGIAEFQRGCAAILQELKNTSPKQGLVLSQYFPKESEAVVLHLKKIDSVLTSLDTFLLSGGKILKLVHLLEAAGKEHAGLCAQRERLGEKESLLLKERDDVEKGRREGRERLDSFLGGSRWQEGERLAEKIALLEKDIQAAKEGIQGELSPLKRILKKAQHAAGQDKILERFLSDPFQSFMAGNGQESLGRILSLAGQLAREGRLQLKGSEQERLAAAQGSLEGGQLLGMKEGYESLLTEKESLSALLQPELERERVALESSLETLESRISSLQQEKEKLKGEREALEQALALKKKEAERIILENKGEVVTIT